MSLRGMTLRRRTLAEQRALHLLRGDTGREAVGTSILQQFGRLRALAEKNGLAIRPDEAAFISVDELRMLGWLARAQRLASYTAAFHGDAMLTMTVVHCAGTLEGLGIRLPQLAINRIAIIDSR